MSDLICAPIAVANAHPLQAAFRITPYGEQSTTPCRHSSVSVMLEETVDQAYDRGIEAGRAKAVLEFSEERQRLLALVASATALQPEPSEELAALIVQAVNRLVRAAMGNVAIDQNWLTARAHEAADSISQCDTAQTLWAHPDDVALLEAAELSLAVIADPDAAPGSIRVGCSSGWIEHGLPLYLEQLEAATAIDRPVR